MTLPVLDDRKKVQRIGDICFSNGMIFLTSASLMTLNVCNSKWNLEIHDYLENEEKYDK